MKLSTVSFSEFDTPAETARKLNALLIQLQARLDVDSVRVGDTTKLGHNGDVTCADVTCADVTCGDVACSDVACSNAAATGTGQFGGAVGIDGKLDCNAAVEVDGQADFNGDVVIDGELKGARGTFTACDNSGAETTTIFLSWNSITMAATVGWVMPRAGSIVTVAGQFKVISSTGGTAKLDIYDGANLAASAGTVTCDDEVGNWVETQATASRGTVPFTAKQVFSAKLTITGTTTIGWPSIVMDVQYDT